MKLDREFYRRRLKVRIGQESAEKFELWQYRPEIYSLIEDMVRANDGAILALEVAQTIETTIRYGRNEQVGMLADGIRRMIEGEKGDLKVITLEQAINEVYGNVDRKVIPVGKRNNSPRIIYIKKERLEQYIQERTQIKTSTTVYWEGKELQR